MFTGGPPLVKAATGEDVTKEELYSEVEQVLRQHPGLKVILAHFYFLSADLPRARRFMDEHPEYTAPDAG